MIKIPSNLKGKALSTFLMEHKDALIAQKKAIPVYGHAVHHAPALFGMKEGIATKALPTQIPEDADSIRVKLVGNTAYWMDTHWDVLLPGCWAKSIQEGKGRKHLHDHIYRLDAEVGDVANIYASQVSLAELGIAKAGTAECLIYESDVRKSYNPKVFDKYKAGKVSQHSIGMQYVKMALAINDPDNEKEYDFWNKHIDQVINREEAEELGFFWVISEVRLLEVSAVLFGANELTPTLEIGETTKAQPAEATAPTPESTPAKSFLEYLSETTLVS